MNTRFFNAKICTMQDDAGIQQGELWVENDRVAFVGNPSGARPAFDREIDVEGNLILPGFKNAHTHSAMTFLRSWADDLPLLDWLNKQVFPMEAKLSGDDAYHLSKLAIMEYLTSGVTANLDMYFYPWEGAQASIDCGFRTVLCGSLNNFVSSVEEMASDYTCLNRLHPLITYRLGFHAEYTCDEALLREVSGLVHKLGAPVYTHCAESRAEAGQCVMRTGLSPVAYLDSLRIFDCGGGCFHCVHVSDGDLDILAKRGMWVVTNPASNCKLASGIAPIKHMLDRNIGVAIGTDGPASNNCLDFFREMFLTTALQKLREDDASVVDADQVLRMATVNGARAMGLWDCDSLAPGKLADLIMIDLQQPNMQPLNNITKNIVYAGSKQNVKLTMVGGKVLYENGQFFIGAKPADIYAKVNEIILSKRV